MIDTAAIWSSMFWFYYIGQGLNDDVIQWMAQAYSEKKNVQWSSRNCNL